MHLRHVLISLFLLGAVCAISALTQYYTTTVCSKTISALEQIEKKPSEANQSLNTVIDNFRDYAKTLSYFHHHSYADTILTYLQRARAYATLGVTTEMYTELEAVKSALETLRKRDALSLGNIF